MDSFLKPEQVAERWGVSVATLGYWRKKNHGPNFHRRGMRTILYSVKEIEQYEQENPALVL